MNSKTVYMPIEYKIISKPKKKHLEQIKSWLKEEKENNISFFYDNFIDEVQYENNFIYLINNYDVAIGYFQYNIFDKCAIIKIAVIKHSERRKGYGKLLLDYLTILLLEKDILVVKLFCVPSSSEKIWKKLGFLRFKEREKHSKLNTKDFNHPWLYKPLITPLKPSKKHFLNSYIELWTEMEYIVYSKKIESTYKWDISNLDLPIIYPVDHEWKIKYVKDNKIIYEGVIKKYFEVNDILIIEEI